MKGIIFNLLETVLTNEHGTEAWESLLAGAEVDGAYTAVGSYPDAELGTLVRVGAEKLSTTPDDLLRSFGRACIPLLVERYPHFFEKRDNTREFLLALNDVIHPEVRKLFPGAYAPSFEYGDGADGGMTMSYLSHRGMCSFAEGLIDGAAAHYGETVGLSQSSCTKRGDRNCTFVLSFARQ